MSVMQKIKDIEDEVTCVYYLLDALGGVKRHSVVCMRHVCCTVSFSCLQAKSHQHCLLLVQAYLSYALKTRLYIADGQDTEKQGNICSLGFPKGELLLLMLSHKQVCICTYTKCSPSDSRHTDHKPTSNELAGAAAAVHDAACDVSWHD